MKKVAIVGSEQPVIEKSKDILEKVEVIAENTSSTYFESRTQFYAEELVFKLKEKLSWFIKSPRFKILVYADENPNSFILEKVHVNIAESDASNEKVRKAVKDAIPDVTDIHITRYVDFVVNSLTENKIRCQEMANSIQNYLVNTYNFKGMTKITAVFEKNNNLIFFVTLSGKGTNDYLVSKVKEIKYTVKDIDNYIMKVFES